jgi:hypothetical protein
MALLPHLHSLPAGLRPARWRAALWLVAGVLLAHAALLALWTAAPGAAVQADGRRPLQLRQITLASAAPVAPDAAPAPTSATQPSAARPTNGPTNGPTTRPTTAATAATAATLAAPAALLAALRSEEAAPEPGGVPAPVYATRLPPSTTLRYALRRSGQAGHAELQWQSDGTQYSLSLRNEATGALNLGSASRGAIDGNGLAPERHTDSRRGRDVRAVNFQRDTARVTFSGPKGEVPLMAGAQDRLSWLLQLAGIAEANPGLRAPGSEIAVFVIGTRGDAEVWLCQVVGPEAIELPAGAVADALHLRREPRRLYDTAVDVWLDPARQHLPVRVRLLVRPTGQETTLALENAAVP